MKKLILIIVTIIVAVLVYVNVSADEIVIPEAAIRVRVIANSNSIYDQEMKMKVKEYIEGYIYPLLKDTKTIDEAREIIQDNVDEMDQGIQELFLKTDYDMKYIIHFGDNYFPEKDYKGVHYEEGAYESLVVSIGEGVGDNWWCVLFPPLCLLEVDEAETDEVEYRFFVTEMLNRIFE